MATEHLLLLTSRNPLQREQGLRKIFELFAACENTASTDGRGLTALFAAVLQHDPNCDVRDMVLGHPLISLDTLCDALLDSNSKVRKTAAETLCKRTLSSDRANLFVPKFFNLLALETHDSNIVTILQILQLMYVKSPNSPGSDITLTALGHSEMSSSVEDIFEVPMYYSILRDLAESDSLQARRALAPVLVAMITSAPMSGEDPSQDALHILQLSFQILETLLQDLYRPVQMAAVDALHQARTANVHRVFKTIGHFSDQSVKCVLRIAKLPVDGQIDDDTRRVLELLTLYPVATLRGYSLAERFLRDQWYQARVSIARSDYDRCNVVGLIRTSLVGIMKSNSGHAQVLDLTRGLSDKSGWITAHHNM